MAVDMLHSWTTQTAGIHRASTVHKDCSVAHKQKNSSKASSMLGTAKGVRLSNGASLEIIKVKANKVRAKSQQRQQICTWIR